MRELKMFTLPVGHFEQNVILWTESKSLRWHTALFPQLTLHTHGHNRLFGVVKLQKANEILAQNRSSSSGSQMLAILALPNSKALPDEKYCGYH